MALVLLAAMLASQPQARLHDTSSSAAAHYQQGLSAERKNDLNAARAEYERAVQIDPSMGVAHDRLGFVLAAWDARPRRWRHSSARSSPAAHRTGPGAATERRHD